MHDEKPFVIFPDGVFKIVGISVQFEYGLNVVAHVGAVHAHRTVYVTLIFAFNARVCQSSV